MGFFQRLGKFLDDLIEWLGQIAKDFIERLIFALKDLWETTIEALLIAAFGASSILYAIIYAGHAWGTTIMEVWDPKYLESKRAEVFEIKQAPQDSPLPKNRKEAKVLELTNWS